MKKSRILAVCLIGLLLVCGMVLASCGSKCPGGGVGNAGDCSFDPANIAGSTAICKDADCIAAKAKAIANSTKWSCDC